MCTECIDIARAIVTDIPFYTKYLSFIIALIKTTLADHLVKG